MIIFLSSIVVAEDSNIVVESPERPTPVQSGEPLEPEVTITQDERGEVHSYAANGKVYKIKVFPSSGPVYYLVDSDGDGNMEHRTATVLIVLLSQCGCCLAGRRY